jgi:UDP-glucose 4-epimerase
MERERILVTGGAGYIGSHTLVELLARPDQEVVSVDNLSNADGTAFQRIERITGRKVRNHAIDLCDGTALESMLEQEGPFAGVIHFAAFKSVPESMADPYKYYHNNIRSLLNMLEASLRYGIKRFIFSSSCSVYGNIELLPVSETTPLGRAESPYAHTKQIGERIVEEYARAHPSLSAISLRYFNPVGAHASGLLGEDPVNPASSLVPVITRTAIGKLPQVTVFGTDYPTRDGSCIRDYVHVSDIASAHVKALARAARNKGGVEVFNLGTGTGVSVLEAIAAFEEVSGTRLPHVLGPRRAGDVGAIWSDTGRSASELGWTAERDLRTMMETAWKWEKHRASEP